MRRDGCEVEGFCWRVGEQTMGSPFLNRKPHSMMLE